MRFQEFVLALRIAQVRDRLSAEIHDFISLVQNGLRHIYIKENVVIVDHLHQGSQFGFTIQHRSEMVDRLGADKWLVALNIDDVIVSFFRLGKCFEAAIGAALVVLRRHYGASAELADVVQYSFIVGCYYNLIELRSFGRLFINPLDHAFAANIHQSLGREAGRSVAGRYYS
ncbi:hypothetical protein D3C87_1484650 [compost metagenome]